MLTIRRYTPADQAAVEELHVVAIRAAGAYLGRGPWDDNIYAIEEHYLNNHGEFLVGETETVQVAAQKSYEKHGFREVGRETYHGFQIILYEKALG